MIQRIVIVGTPGSGKSTLCSRIGETLHIPYYHLDHYAWEGRTLVKGERLQKQVEAIVATEAWIVDGTYSQTLDQRLARADVLIVLSDTRWRCILRVVRRYIKGKFQSQIGDNPDTLSFEFIKYIWNYERDVLPKVYRIYQRHAQTCRLWER